MNYPWITEANRIFTGVLIGQAVIALIIAFFTGTYMQAIVGSILFISLPLILIASSPHNRNTRIVVGVAVQLMAALHIQQAGGLTEIHFEIFVVLAFLSFYRDWMVILASVAVVAVHHVLFFFLQSQGAGVVVFEEGHVTFGILLIHAFFAVAEGVVLMYVTNAIHREATAAHTLSSSVHQILETEGEFKLDIPVDTKNEELAEFNLLIGSFKTLIAQAKQISNGVSENAGKVANISRQIEKSATFNMDQVANIASSTEQMSASNADVSSRASEASELSRQCSENTNEAKKAIEQANQDITELGDHLTDASDTINKLASMCTKIDEAMASIKVVADQTNLLALNAAIESARAGEHGRGFSVVADEVRQLAGNTTNYANDISVITSELINEANNSVEKIKLCVEGADSTRVSANDATESMNNVSSFTMQLDENIDSVATAVEEQTKVSSNIAGVTQQLHESTDNQHVVIKESSVSIDDLMSDIRTLNAELSKFSV
ncbi:MAG: methyl-accepting chemotaxis protein [Alteromonadaceae bacterium]|nr:methyl-accepting chemotaxis protein [Alteromonadaceae bacterium]